jgi:hypothetical protein
MAQVQQEVWFYELHPYFTGGVFMDTSTHTEYLYISSNVLILTTIHDFSPLPEIEAQITGRPTRIQATVQT